MRTRRVAHGMPRPQEAISIPERRQSPRFPVDRPLQAHLSIDVSLDVLDLSTGGMCTRSSSPLRPGATHLLLIRVKGLAPMALLAHAVHCELAEDHLGYFIGWRWAKDPRTSRSVFRLIEHVIDVLPLPPLSRTHKGTTTPLWQ